MSETTTDQNAAPAAPTTEDVKPAVSAPTPKASRSAATAPQAAPAPLAPPSVPDVLSSSFHYPIPREYAGRVQFCVDRAESMDLDRLGRVSRGQVIEVKREAYARSLVATGRFAFAPADSPIGQPSKFAPSAP
jgi:hypothetical protein